MNIDGKYYRHCIIYFIASIFLRLKRYVSKSMNSRKLVDILQRFHISIENTNYLQKIVNKNYINK